MNASEPAPEGDQPGIDLRTERIRIETERHRIEGVLTLPADGQRQPVFALRTERIRSETERHRIEGVLTLARDGYRSRVSDVLNASERDFITLTDVTVAPLDGGPIELHAHLSLARRHIVFAVAAEPT